MNIRRLLFILIALSFYNLGFAQIQRESNNRFEFSTGYNIGALKNLEYAPLSRYDYQGPVYKLGYEHSTKNKKIFRVQLDFLTTELLSDLIPVLNLDYIKLGLNIQYLKQAFSTDRFSIHAGLRSRSNVSIYTTSNFDGAVIDHSFGLASQFGYRINEKQALFSSLSIPVVLFRVTDRDSGIYSFNRYQSALFNMGYKHSLSKYLDFKFSYDFNYDRLQISNAFREIQYQFNLGLNFKF